MTKADDMETGMEATQLPLPPEIVGELRNTPQNPKFHAEGSVFNHTLLVLSQFYQHHGQFQLSERDYQALYWSVLTHDVGKPVVTQWVQGRWSARGHEAAGVPIARNILLQRPDIDPDQRQRILSMVRYHSAPLQMYLRGATIDQYKQLACKVDIRLLGQFAWFDLHGRICIKQDEVYSSIDHFLHEIVPRVEYELGTYDQIQAVYQQSPHLKKNALWYSLQQRRSDLLEKILRAPAPADAPSATFTVVVPVGPPKAGKTAYLRQRFPDHRFFDFELPTHEASHPHVRTNHMRSARHFISVFGKAKAGRQLVVEGPWMDDDYRAELLAWIRQEGGAIHLIQFERRQEELMERVDTSDMSQWLQLYRRQSLLHPWEGHQIEVVS